VSKFSRLFNTKHHVFCGEDLGPLSLSLFYFFLPLPLPPPLALLCGAGWVLCLMEFARISSLLDHTTKLKGIHFFFQTSQNMTVTNFEIFSLTWALSHKI
jgi:hypothetical protein